MKQPSNTTISSIKFIKGVVGTDPIVTDGKPHIVFIGRSNVGKSSTLNSLSGQNNIAHTSGKPGKTQRINFFLVNNGLYFVDLPGYGYAKISAKRAEKLRKHVIWYLSESGASIALAVLIIDVKVGLTRYDKDMLDILAGEDLPTVVLANKIDRLNQKEAHTALGAVKEGLQKRGVHTSSIIPFSAKTGMGKDELLNLVFYNR